MTQNEIWKPVLLNEEKTKYEVSNKGRVRDVEKDKFLNSYISNKGYHRYDIRHNVKSKTNLKLAHRLVLFAFSPIENPEKYAVHHKDGIKSNNRLENLQWLTFSDHANLEMELGNVKIHRPREESYKFKGYIGEFSKDGTLLNFYAGRRDIERSGKTNTCVYDVALNLSNSYQNLIFRRFPKGTKPEIGKKYDLYDGMFTQFFKYRLSKIPNNSIMQLELGL